MAKRTYTRRTDEERIQDLESKLQEAREKLEEQRRRDSPILRELTKVQRALRTFSEVCRENRRLDLSNSAQAFSVQIARQCEPESDEPVRRGRSASSDDES